MKRKPGLVLFSVLVFAFITLNWVKNSLLINPTARPTPQVDDVKKPKVIIDGPTPHKPIDEPTYDIPQIIEANSVESSYPTQPTPDSKAIGTNSRQLFVGIITTIAKFERRSLIRATYLSMRPPEITLMFIVGTPKNDDEKRIVKFETLKFNDIIVLDCEENMNSGKSIEYFRHVSQFAEYDYFMKADDDVYLHLPNLSSLAQVLPKENTYYGRMVTFKLGFFMAGCGYILSKDLATFIGHNPDCYKTKQHQEDEQISICLTLYSDLKEFTVPTDETVIYDSPQKDKDVPLLEKFNRPSWSHEYIDDTLLVHQVKETSYFLHAHDHFYKKYKNQKMTKSNNPHDKLYKPKRVASNWKQKLLAERMS
jgi:hypothetical protein